MNTQHYYSTYACENILLELIQNISTIITYKPQTNTSPFFQEYTTASIETKFSTLDDTLKKEKFTNTSNMFGELKTAITAKNWVLANASAHKLLRIVRPFAIHDVLQSIGKTESTAIQTKEQDAILFLGSSGAGKSTAIHFLAGSSMQTINVNGLPHIYAEQIANVMAQKIKINPHYKHTSAADDFIAVPINYRASANNAGGNASKCVILCDTPGFSFDASGRSPEVDLINAFRLVNTATKFKSIRLLFFISHMEVGDRLQNLRAIFHLLAQLINHPENHLNSLSYIFSKFDEKEFTQLTPKVDNLLGNLTADEKADTTFVALCKSLQDKLKSKSIPMTLDLCSRKPQIADAFLRTFMQSTQSITRPDLAFKMYVSNPTQTALQEQLNHIQLAISRAPEENNYTFINHKLNEMFSLREVFPAPYVRQSYAHCINYLENHINKTVDGAFDKLIRYPIDTNNLSDHDMQQCVTAIAHINAIAESEIMELRQLANKKQDAINTAIEIKIKEFATTIQKTDIDNDILLKTLLDKFNHIIKCFCAPLQDLKSGAKIVQTIIDQHAELHVFFVNYFGKLSNQLTSAMEQKSMEQVAGIIAKLKKAKTLLHETAYAQKIENCYTDAVNNLYMFLNNILLNSIKGLNKDLSGDELCAIKTDISLVEFAKANTIITHFLSTDANAALQKNYSDFTDKTMHLFNDDSDKIPECLNRNAYDVDFITVKKIWDNMIKYREITPPAIANKTNKIFEQTGEKICACISDIGIMGEKSINLIFDADMLKQSIKPKCEGYSTDNHYKILYHCLIALSNAQLINHYFVKNVCSVNAGKIIAFLQTKITALTATIAEQELGMKDFHNFQQSEKLIIMLEKLLPVHAILPQKSSEITKSIHDAVEVFRARIRIICDTICKNLSLDDKTIVKQKAYVKQLTQAGEANTQRKDEQNLTISENKTTASSATQEAIAYKQNFTAQDELNQTNISEAEYAGCTYVFTRLSISPIGNACRCLMECEKTTKFKQEKNLIEEALKKYLLAYFHDTQKMMQWYFSNIINYGIKKPNKPKPSAAFFSHQILTSSSTTSIASPVPDENTILHYARQLFEQLQGLSLLKANSNESETLISDCNQCLEEWKNRLAEYLIFYLENTLRNLAAMGELSKLSKKIVIAKALSAVDIFLSERAEIKYIKLYREYQDKLYQEIRNAAQEVTNAVQEYKFEDALCVIEKLSALYNVNSDTAKCAYNRACNTLQKGLDTFLTEISMQVILLGHKLELTMCCKISINLDKFTKALKISNKHLAQKSLAELCEKNTQIKTCFLNSLETYLECISGAISTHDFYEADTRLELITKIYNILNTCDWFKAREKEHKDSSLQNKITATRSALNSLPDKLCELYNRPITQYNLQPPKAVLSKLMSVLGIEPKYNQILERLKEIILLQFKSSLKAIENEQNKSIKKRLIDDLDFAIKHYLPESLTFNLGCELKLATTTDEDNPNVSASAAPRSYSQTH